MQRCKLGTYAGGVSGMTDICNLLNIGVDPQVTPVEYSSTGDDLNGIPIEAGLGNCVWRWDVMPQKDYEYLLDFVGSNPGAQVYLRTKTRSGAQGYDFDNFLGVMRRPVASRTVGLVHYDIEVAFQMLEPA